MSFLKQLLNPFIEFDADKKEEAAQQPVPPQPAPKAPAASTPAPQKLAAQAPPPPQPAGPAQHPLITDKATSVAATQVPTYSPSGTLIEPLPEHVQYFEKLIDEANRTNPYFQGIDYKEFVDSKVDIDDIQDETLKYRTAYNVFKSTGLTIEKLKATGQEYLNLIGRDLNAFQGAHAQQYKKEVGQKEALIQKKAEELQALAQRMNALKTEINSLTQDVDLTKESLNTTKASFLLAGERKQKEIETELQKIAQYFS
ncbi:hypothetical protein HRH25_12455 [Flavisolibacter sp. BT320]|nr:hypothetical protein [Flavisolibacter longurius]